MHGVKFVENAISDSKLALEAFYGIFGTELHPDPSGGIGRAIHK